jgi:hypothetical protein
MNCKDLLLKDVCVTRNACNIVQISCETPVCIVLSQDPM